MKFEVTYQLDFIGHKTAPEPMKLLVKTYVVDVKDEEKMPELLIGLRDKVILENIACEMTDLQPIVEKDDE